MDLQQTSVGLELGSTRIKAVLIGPDFTVLAQGDHPWENKLEDGYWTYSPEEVWSGIQAVWAALAADVQNKLGQPLTTTGCLGISAMMHGYLPFDRDGNQLAAFRTWRNTTTGPAAEKLSALFGCNIPQRWSIAHLYQAVLNGEEHLQRLDFLTTLAGYVHWRLTGQKVLGVGDASGMFPLQNGQYDPAMLAAFGELTKDQPWKLSDILPAPLPAGAAAGNLTAVGARLLDPTGVLRPGLSLCPPEGDAGTGMTATNSVQPGTGNISAGTSIFSMMVLEKPLSKRYPEIDMVTTPDGAPVAMIHCNNCTNELNAWASLFGELLTAAGAPMDAGKLFTLLFQISLSADANAGGLLPVNYLSGEGVTHFDAGCPLLVRGPKAALSLANFMRAQIYSSFATLCLGMELLRTEQVNMERMTGHGGLFKTPGVAQKYLAAAIGTPVTCMQTAGEGGPYGMALLAAYAKEPDGTLPEFLAGRVFADAVSTTEQPDETIAAGFAEFLQNYKQALRVERTAVEVL